MTMGAFLFIDEKHKEEAKMLKTEKGFLSAYFTNGLSKTHEVISLHPELGPYVHRCQAGSHCHVSINGFPVRSKASRLIPGDTLRVQEFDAFYAQAMQEDGDPEFVGLVIKDGEKERLREVCERYAIPIPYPKLFIDGKEYHLWVVSTEGIGLAGTIVMRNLPKVLHGIGQLTVWLESLGSGKTPDYAPQGQPIVVRAKDDKELSALIATLRRDYGFRSERPIREGGCKGPQAGSCPWIFANVEGHSYWRGKAGICYARPVFNRWVSPRDFLAILDIVYGSAKIESGRP